MAFAASEPVAGVASTSNNTTYSLGSFTPTAGALLFVEVSTSGNDNDGSISNTGTSLTWNRVATVLTGAGGGFSTRLFWAVVPASVSASVITFTPSGGISGCLMSIIQVTGQNPGSNPIRQYTTTNGTGTSPNPTMAAAMKTENAYVLCGGIEGITTITDPSGWTRTQADFYIAPSTAAGMFYRLGGESGASVSYSFSSSVPYAVIMVEIFCPQNLTAKMQQYEGA